MGIKQAISKATERAKVEALTNNWRDSMMFVVWDEPYRGEGRYIVLNEENYDRGQGIGDIDLAAATVWSDGKSVEVERYQQGI